MQDHSSALVQQAIMVSEELIRVAILWHEQWHEGLEDASRWGEGWGGGRASVSGERRRGSGKASERVGRKKWGVWSPRYKGWKGRA